MRKNNVRRSADTKPYARARKAYDEGKSLRYIKRNFHLTNEEMRDVAPDEFADDIPQAEPEGNGGY